jgi:hypothetical protein
MLPAASKMQRSRFFHGRRDSEIAANLQASTASKKALEPASEALSDKMSPTSRSEGGFPKKPKADLVPIFKRGARPVVTIGGIAQTVAAKRNADGSE